MIRTFLIACLCLLAALCSAQEPRRLDLNYTATFQNMGLRWSSLHNLDNMDNPLRYSFRWDYGLTGKTSRFQLFAEQSGSEQTWLSHRSLGLSYSYTGRNTSLMFGLSNNFRLDQRAPDHGLSLRLDLKSSF